MNVSKLFENFSKKTLKNACKVMCRPKFQHTTDADSISAATEQRDVEENEKDESNEGNSDRFNEGTAVQYVDTFLEHMDRWGAITVILQCQGRFKPPWGEVKTTHKNKENYEIFIKIVSLLWT